MATKDELIDENATLRARVAELEARMAQGSGHALDVDISAHVARSAAWVEAMGLQVLPDLEGGAVKGWLLCTAEGLPVDAYVSEGVLTDELPHHADLGDAEKDGDGEKFEYVEGEGFVSLNNGATIKLERWRVREDDGTFSEPKEGVVYRYDGSHDLIRVPVGDESELAVMVETLQADKLRLATALDEKRDEVAALNRRLNHGQALHGAVDALPPVV